MYKARLEVAWSKTFEKRTLAGYTDGFIDVPAHNREMYLDKDGYLRYRTKGKLK